MSDCTCTNFPTSLGNITFGPTPPIPTAAANVGIGLANPAYSLHAFGGGAYLQGLATPTIANVTVNTPGNDNYYYFVIALDRNSRRTPLSAKFRAASAASPPDNTITWDSVDGASAYVILRYRQYLGSPDMPLQVAQVNAPTTSYEDKMGDGSLSIFSLPDHNETGDLFVDGVPTFGSDLVLGAATRDPFAWHTQLTHGQHIALAANNGAMPGTTPRNRGFVVSDDTIGFFDAAANITQHASGFQLALFDGKRVYFLPYGTNSNPKGGFLAYDTTQDFGSVTSYEYADLPTLLGNAQGPNVQAAGFLGGCLDDQGYLYFVPYVYLSGTTPTPNPLFVQFDTRKAVGDPTAYVTFDASVLSLPALGWATAVFDGRYVYYCPLNSVDTGALHGVIVRYDTTGAFGDSSSWSYFDLASNVDASLEGFQTIIFDGRYVYLVPYAAYSGTTVVLGGTIARYDTTLPFASAGSWQHQDLTTINSGAVGFTGACLIGRYLYMVPWGGTVESSQPTIVARFDTLDPAGFSSTTGQGWSFFDLLGLPQGSVPTVGYEGAWSDGIFLYLVPTYNYTAGAMPPFVRYDTRLAFSDLNAWTVAAYSGTTTIHPWTGAAWDGHYAYLCPYGASTSGLIGRLAGVTPSANDLLGEPFASRDLFRNSQGRIGIGTETPEASLEVASGYIVDTFNAGTATSYPTYTPNGGVALGWNFSNGGAEADLWNTFNGGDSYVRGFRFRQQTGAASFRDLLTLQGDTGDLYLWNGGIAIGAFAGTSPPVYGIIVPGRVGIVTSAPLSALDVAGGIAIGAYAGTVPSPSDGLIVSGNVGVGTSSPQATLHGTGSTILGAANAAVPSGNLGNSQVNVWVNESTNELTFQVKYSDGTVKNGTVALS